MCNKLVILEGLRHSLNQYGHVRNNKCPLDIANPQVQFWAETAECTQWVYTAKCGMSLRRNIGDVLYKL